MEIEVIIDLGVLADRLMVEFDHTPAEPATPNYPGCEERVYLVSARLPASDVDVLPCLSLDVRDRIVDDIIDQLHDHPVHEYEMEAI